MMEHTPKQFDIYRLGRGNRCFVLLSVEPDDEGWLMILDHDGEVNAVRPKYLSDGSHEFVGNMAAFADLLAACEEVVNVLGPEPPDCGCAGCESEMGMALSAARAAIEKARA